MPGHARFGDIAVGVCICHPIPIPTIAILVTFSGDVITNSRGTVRCADIGITPCGHIGVVVTCSGDVITNERGTARCGDALVGCFNGVIATCSGDTYSNG